jgi:4-amino-4-deoxy-L-arabinose transferase-like glycosyltransferase
MKLFDIKWFILLMLLAAIAYSVGLFIDLLEPDACQYANISMEMLQKKSFLQVFYRGENYLDKPPLVFWLSSLSYSLFGISTFAYRLPSFLFTILGVYSSYRLASSLYNKNVGLITVIILITCQAYFLFNHDVRADTMLTGSVIFGIWQLHKFLNNNNIKNLIFGFVGISLAMLSKGPIGIVVPILAFAPDFVYRKKWKNFFKWQWLLGLLVIAIMLTPMMIGLYKQFGAYGLWYYFWIQSFGRITGENVWNNQPGPFLLYSSFLWAFMPWCILAVFAVFDRLKMIFLELKNKLPRSEIFIFSGIVLTFYSLTRSHYQLPHYIFVIFPLFAIITAAFIEKLITSRTKIARVFEYGQLIVCCVLWAFTIFLFGYCFPGLNPVIWVLWIIIIVLAIMVFFKYNLESARLIIPSALTMIGINIILNIHFYPYILTFQAGSSFSEIIREKNIPLDHVYMYKNGDPSPGFYSRHVFTDLDEKMVGDSISHGKKIWLYTDQANFNILKENFKPSNIYPIDYYRITKLTPKFINPKTRNKTLTKRYLLEI